MTHNLSMPGHQLQALERRLQGVVLLPLGLSCHFITSRRLTYTRCEVRWQQPTEPNLTLSTKPKLTVWKLSNTEVCLET
jgi:hypothetical protein